MDHYYYELADGQIWSTEAAGWVEQRDVPEGTISNRLYQSGRPAGVDYLIAVLKEYGYELGELAEAGE